MPHDNRRLIRKPFPLLLSALALSHAVGCAREGATNGPPEIAFSRIIHGWSNYSTAFNATHDTGASGDYATVASFYTPATDVVPLDYAAIIIAGDSPPLDFARFQFRVFVWSNLATFVQEPRQGDVATWSLAAPTAGSTAVPDTQTRGGRTAYEVRFSLTNSPVILSNQHTYLVGFAARTDTQRNGELFVPTASQEGSSDVQAGDLVVGGWRYLVNAGGSTIYSGQLAVELIVAPRINSPPLHVTREGSFVRISWPASAQNFVLEYALSLAPNADWFPVEVEPFEEDGFKQVVLPATFTRQWFRLRR
jgi:hypothetical protein